MALIFGSPGQSVTAVTLLRKTPRPRRGWCAWKSLFLLEKTDQKTRFLTHCRHLSAIAEDESRKATQHAIEF